MSASKYIIIYDLIGHICHWYMLVIIYWWEEHQTPIIISIFFYKRYTVGQTLRLSTAKMHGVFRCLGIHTYASYESWQHGNQQDMTEVIMALPFNYNHIVYYHMVAQ